jgi:hypothetical protein
MRPDKSKAQAQQESNAKDEKKNPDDRDPRQAASKQADPYGEDTLASVRHSQQKKGPTLH